MTCTDRSRRWSSDTEDDLCFNTFTKETLGSFLSTVARPCLCIKSVAILFSFQVFHKNRSEVKEVILGVTFVQQLLKDTHYFRVADRGQCSKCSGEIRSLVNQPFWSCLTFYSQYTELIIKAPGSSSLLLCSVRR